MITTLLQEILDRLLPPRCTTCRAADALFCDRCWQQIKWIEPPLCHHCGKAVPQKDAICGQCYHTPSPLEQVRAAVWFGRPVRRVIHQLKYNQRTAVIPPLVDMMASSWKLWHGTVDLIVPVPLHPKREMERGFNQSGLLAERFAGIVGIPVENEGVFRVRPTKQQVGLPRKARIDNVSGAFMANRKLIANQRILLIDDVVTTGATLDASAESLLTAGAASVSAYCLARAGRPLKHTRSYDYRTNR